MNGPVRVALLAGPLAPREPVVLAKSLIRHLPPLGVAPILVGREGAHSTPMAAAGAEFVESPVTGRALTEALHVRRLGLALKEREIRLVHVLDPALARHGSRLSVSLEVPWILSTDGLLPGLRELPDAIVVPSRSARDGIVTRWRTVGPLVRVVPPGIDPDDSRAASPPFGGGMPVIGTVILRENPQGLAGVLRAGKHLLDAGRDLHILIAGSVGAERTLRRKARDLGVSRHVTVADVPEAYMRIFESLDLFVRPGRRGGFGISMLAAMAAGRPVVAAGEGTAFAFVREGVTGFLAPRRDSAALAERIAWFFDHRDRAGKMGRAGRDLVTGKFTASVFAERTAAIYRSVLGHDR